MTYEYFWAHTPAEHTFWLDQMMLNRLEDLQSEATFMYWLAVNIGRAYHEPKDLPESPQKAFPHIFKVEELDEASQFERFIEGARAHNRRRGGDK